MTELKTGDKAPDFELMDQDGNSVKLSDFAGRKVLMYFYPKASTPGCTIQSCHVRDAKEDFSGLNTAVIGVSPDAEAKQKRFDEKHSFGFPLLCDTEHTLSEAYGVWRQKSMFGKKYMGILRSSFLIDENGKIIKAWYKISPGDTVPEAKKELNK